MKSEYMLPFAMGLFLVLFFALLIQDGKTEIQERNAFMKECVPEPGLYIRDHTKSETTTRQVFRCK